jgi:phage protein D
MSVINKELYDALILAKVPEEKAAAAARPLGDISQLKDDVSDLKVDIADVKARLSNVERLQWVVILGIVGLLIKSFLG